jgi:hypothetical protein
MDKEICSSPRFGILNGEPAARLTMRSLRGSRYKVVSYFQGCLAVYWESCFPLRRTFGAEGWTFQEASIQGAEFLASFALLLGQPMYSTDNTNRRQTELHPENDLE